jgi:hypothetical protein
MTFVQVDMALNNLATAVTELHPMAEGTCNVTYTRENDRCRCVPTAVSSFLSPVLTAAVPRDAGCLWQFKRRERSTIPSVAVRL